MKRLPFTLVVFNVVLLVLLAFSIPPSEPLADTLRQESVTLCQIKEVANGSGILVRHGKHVFIWTAAHVVQEHRRLRVYQMLPDGTRSHNRAVVLACDPVADIAVLHVEFLPETFRHTALFRSQPPQYGQRVFHVGSFLGDKYPASFSSGVVSFVQRGSYMQIDVPAFPGSSGGGVFDEDGGCVGMLVRQADPNINFCIPAGVIREWAKQHRLEFAL